MHLQLRKWHHNCWPKQPIILCDWLLGMKTARCVGIAICKGNHSAWWGGWPLESLTDRLNDGSFSACPYVSLHKSAVPVTAHPMKNTGGLFYDIALKEVKVLSSVQVVIFLIQHIFIALLWCLKLRVFSVFILFLCLLFLCAAAGRKLLHANCVRHRHSQLALHCHRQLNKIEWGKAAHIFTVVIKAQWGDFLLQLYVSWQLLPVPASASYGQAQ